MHERRASLLGCAAGIGTMLLLLLLMSGCQTSSRVGDRYYERGRLPEAAAAYEVYLDSQPSDTERTARTLLRLGVIFGTPGSAVYDPQRSVEMLDQLIHDCPRSVQVGEAVLLRQLQLKIIDLDAGIAADRLRLIELEAELAERENELTELGHQLGAKEDQILALEESIRPLRGEISDLIHELATKQAELEQLERLKAIDLDQQPP